MAGHYDIIIVGTGAGGATLAQHLAPSGKRILLLERGGHLPREKENWDSREVFVNARYKAHETWFDKEGREFHPGIHYFVGGSTTVYGAVLLRFRKQDFGEIRHHGGVSPAWPISYEDLAPYYLKAEQLHAVHGLRGSDPTEPPASEPYPCPPVAHEPRIQELHNDLKRLGLHPFPLPLGVRLDEANRHISPCIKCETCDGFPCLVDAKGAHIASALPAAQYPNVTLLTHAHAERLETDPSGRMIKRVIVKRNGTQEEYSGDIVVVSCGAINSAALLLRSANDRHPHGMANSSGVVGRHYMCHNNSALVAISRHPNPTRFQKTLGLNDYYFRDKDWEYPLGHIQMLGKTDEEMFREDAPALAPGMALDVMARHSLDFWLTSEDLADPDNRVVVNSEGSIALHYRENNLKGHTRLIAKLKAMLKDIGCEDHLIPWSLYLGKKIPIAGTAHQCGTVRFGMDPKSSALDVNCRAHDLDNLYVVDGSFFVSSTAVNPSLTIMANALRVGDHLLDRMK
jgi:choline dehydrogenase-like flavoprotein